LASRQAYQALGEVGQRQLVAFLQHLVLYQTDQLPCDMDGDGKIAEHFIVQKMDTGLELFNPEWLFRVPGKIEGKTTNVRGDRIHLERADKRAAGLWAEPGVSARQRRRRLPRCD